MHVAFDVDDVIADMMPVWLERIYVKYGRPVHVKAENLTIYDFWKAKEFEGVTEEQVWAALTPDIYEEVEPFTGVFLALDKIKSAGHDISFVSRCFTKDAAVAKMFWMARWGFNDYGRFYSVGDWKAADLPSKGAFKANILFDDHLVNCLEWEQHRAGQKPRVAFLVDRPHNRSATGVYRVMTTEHYPMVVQQAESGLYEWGKPFITSTTVSAPAKTTVSVGSELKETNPKDMVATNKVPMDLVPSIALAWQSVAHLDGNLKYGLVNWRATGVRASVYIAAAMRHIQKMKDGEWINPDSGVPHAAHVCACMNILMDADHNAVLVDDRPIGSDTDWEEVEGAVAALRELHKDRNPKHYTREDV